MLNISATCRLLSLNLTAVDDDMKHDWMINQRMLVKPQGIFYIFDKTGKLFAKGGSSNGTSRSEEEFVATAAR